MNKTIGKPMKQVLINGILWDREDVHVCPHILDNEPVMIVEKYHNVRTANKILKTIGKRLPCVKHYKELFELGCTYSPRTNKVWVGKDSHLLSKSKHSVAFNLQGGYTANGDFYGNVWFDPSIKSEIGIFWAGNKKCGYNKCNWYIAVYDRAFPSGKWVTNIDWSDDACKLLIHCITIKK